MREKILNELCVETKKKKKWSNISDWKSKTERSFQKDSQGM